MKLKISAVLASLLASADLHALPIPWDVELTAQPPQVFTLQRPRGETYELESVLKDHGKPFEPAITNACIYWQTNGMENLYWSAPASVSNNVLRASWLPSMDPGATTVRGYIGDPGHIYAAAFQFRFISSPGATPNELPLPQKVIDFAKVTVLNPPWSGGGEADSVYWDNVIDKPSWFDHYGLYQAYINDDPTSENLWNRFKVNKLGSETGTEDLPEYLASGAWNTNTGTNRFARIGDIPTSSDTIRTYDRVRNCWWVLEMVNGVPTWTVED